MSRGRYVVLGLAHPRAEWFRDVAQWANSAAIPVDFVKCLSAEELRARLRSGRAHSALLADANLPAVDRDLLALARDSNCAGMVVDDGRTPRDWVALGATAVLPARFGRAELLDVLVTHARVIVRADTLPNGQPSPSPLPPWRGAVVTVLGAGGAGSSTIAVAAAQALARDVRYGASVVLADLCLRAEQAMLHDCGAVAPGIQELVEAHRGGQPHPDETRRLTFPVPERGYDLLIGLRRSRFWPSLRPAAFTAAFGSLARTWQAVVVDTDSDLEGEAEGGSMDVEERNVMARTAAAEADLVLCVGTASMKGLHALTRVLSELAEHEVPGHRVVPVLNQAPRTPRQRSAYVSALVALRPERGAEAMHPPVFVPRRPVDTVLRDGARLPSAVVDPIGRVIARQLAHGGDVVVTAHDRFRRVRPGSLGHWDAEGDGDEEVAG